MAKLDHIGLYVKNIEKSLMFYKEIFGFKQVDQFTSGEAKIVTLDIGGALLELIQRPGSPGNPPEGNWSHIAIHEPNFDKIVMKLDKNKIEKRLTAMSNGTRLCFFNDLDGHTVEIMETGFQ